MLQPFAELRFPLVEIWLLRLETSTYSIYAVIPNELDLESACLPIRSASIERNSSSKGGVSQKRASKWLPRGSQDPHVALCSRSSPSQPECE